MADKAEEGKTEEHSSWTVDAFPLNDHFNESYCDGLNFTFCLNHSSFNYTTTYLNATEPSVHSFDIFMGVVSIVLGFMILITVIGNVFVIAAILLERNLQNVANYLIVSLAVADLMVACLVMPLGAVYEIMKGWVLGPELCDMWTSCDVLCCTASILHLVAIAVDRYWAVTDLDYIHTRNVNKIGMMIIVVWTVALVVSLAPQFGWKDPDYLDRINSQKRCLVSQDVAYQIFATCSTFYVPLLVILILYWKIFQTARKRIRKNQKLKSPVVSTKSSSNRNLIIARNFLPKRRFKNFKRNSKQNSATKALVSSLLMTEGQSTATVDAMFPDDATESRKNSDAVPEPEMSNSNELKFDDQNLPSGRPEVTTAFTISMRSDIDDILNTGSSDNVSPEKSSGGATNDGSHQSHMSDMSRLEMLRSDVVGGSGKSCGIINVGPGISSYGTAEAIVKAVNPMQIHREKKESLEAKRERKAAKTLAIITGAFVICWLPFFIMAILMPLFGPISDHLASFFLWLGYFNSTLNPVIYTVFSPEFRQAFKRILCGAPRRNSYYRSGTWR